jgi:hypothetical protein
VGRRDPVRSIDTARYPFDQPDAFIAAARADLRRSGVAILPGFLGPEAVGRIVAECDRLALDAHHSVVEGTPYLALPEEGRPEGHPRRALVRSALGAVAYDRFPVGSELRELYEWDGLMELVAAMLGREPLHRYADPLGALNLAVMTAGDELGWHFDQTDFVVSIALQASEGGGEFEAATHIRTDDDERYDEVAAALRGEPTREVVSVPMEPGTLMLFEGRRSLHRVTPIVGPRPRYVALLAYDTRPDTDSSDLLKLVRYGRLP